MTKFNWERVAIEKRISSNGSESYSLESDKFGCAPRTRKSKRKIQPCPNCKTRVAASLLQQHLLIDCPKIRKKAVVKQKFPCKVCGRKVTKAGYKEHFRTLHESKATTSPTPKSKKESAIDKRAKHSKDVSKNNKSKMKMISPTISKSEEGTDSLPFNEIRINS